MCQPIISDQCSKCYGVMRKVVVFKAPPDNPDDVDPYVAILRDAGWEAETFNVLSFEYTNQGILRNKLKRPHDFGGLIFTSPRSVTAVHQCAEEDEFDTAKWSVLPAYVVGEGTKRVLQDKLGLVGIGQQSGSAHKLGEFICEDMGSKESKPLLFPCAELKHNALPECLASAGIMVDCVTAYQTVAHPKLEHNLEIMFGPESCILVPDVLVFFSPSGVHSVVPLLKQMGVDVEQKKIIAIGPTTESALKEESLSVYATAARPSPTYLLEAMQGLD